MSKVLVIFSSTEVNKHLIGAAVWGTALRARHFREAHILVDDECNYYQRAAINRALLAVANDNSDTHHVESWTESEIAGTGGRDVLQVADKKIIVHYGDAESTFLNMIEHVGGLVIDPKADMSFFGGAYGRARDNRIIVEVPLDFGLPPPVREQSLDEDDEYWMRTNGEAILARRSQVARRREMKRYQSGRKHVASIADCF